MKKGANKDIDRVCSCETLLFIDKLKTQADNRNDEMGRKVLCRLATTIDLPAAEAKYHNRCRINFFRPKKPHLQNTGDKKKAFDFLCDFLKDTSECQYSICELEDILKENMSNDVEGYSRKHLERKLKDHFGDNLLVTSLPGKPNVITFRRAFSKIVHQSWYDERNPDPRSEKRRMTSTVAEIVAADIRSMPCECDVYPSPRSLEVTALQEAVPETLHCLVEGIISQQGRLAKNTVLIQRKSVAIEQAIMSATRPRSFLSPMLIGLGVYLHRKYDSKNLINVLHAFGFCCSYKEARRYQWSALFGSSPFPADDEAFVQFIFDNADHNVKTLDGYGTFHSMGGIKCVTPCPERDDSLIITRLQKDPGPAALGRFGDVPHHDYIHAPKTGLALIKVKDVSKRTSLANYSMSALRLDYMWLASFSLDITPVPGWAGFNQLVTESQSNVFHVSDVVALPFINLNPSDMSTIYSALVFAQKEASLFNRSYCIVTFDQPLFIKAVDIVHASAELRDSVIVRLGGLHMTFSYMGSDGYIMSGSGQEQMWSTAYAAGSIPRMVSGHYYSRALHARILSVQAIASVLLASPGVLNQVDAQAFHRTWDDLLHENISLDDALSRKEVLQVTQILEKEIDKARNFSRTATLWIEHFDRVLTLLGFIRAERTGDWALHIDSVRKMLPTFHAAGHLAYAKSAQLYLQEMERLEEVLPTEDFEKYITLGYFTIRRTNRFWAGIWTDMTIEQVLMKSMKVQGGLTRGRGITDSTLVYFISALPPCIPIMEALENLSGTSSASSEQHMAHKDHKELRPARQKRDATDLLKFIGWLKTHNPFDPKYQTKLISVFNGISADETINCDQAHQVGSKLQKEMVGKNFADMMLKRSAKVLPLSAMTSTIKVRGEAVVIDQQQMLNRMLAVLQSGSELENFVQYEFVNYAPSLFDNFSMRKTNKAALAQSLELDKHIITDYGSPSAIIIDGGHLLHVVIWPTPLTYAGVIDLYVKYVLSHYNQGRIIIVFDGYSDKQTTKSLEQRRRAAVKSSADISLILHAQTTTSQQEFLNNPQNKTALIIELTQALLSTGVEVEQASGDADLSIALSAMAAADTSSGLVVVVSRDTDILVILLARLRRGEIILVQPQPGKPAKLINIQQVKTDLGCELCDVLLPLHAMTGCDTTSAPFRKGKKKPLMLAKRSKEFRSYLATFNSKRSDKASIAEAGEKLMMMMYNVEQFQNLDRARYFRLKQIIARQGLSSTSKLSTLPPTSGSAKMHSFRVFLQVQSWYGNDCDPLDLGWELKAGNLLPIGSDRAAAPERLLKLIYCDCKAGCRDNSACRCRKAHEACNPMCGHCMGLTCTNVFGCSIDVD